MPSSTITKREILFRHPFFVDLDAKTLDRLVGYARVESFRAKRRIFEEGSSAQSLYGVLKGRVRISGSSKRGGTITYRVIQPGEVFGEIALLDGKPRSADATAMTDCELLILERRDFMECVRSNPIMIERLLAVLCERVRLTTKQVGDLMFSERPSRVAQKLIELAGNIGGEDSRVTIRITQQELGYMLGLSRETTNKQLAQWQKAGLLKAGKGFITILSPRRLWEAAIGLES